MAYRFAIRSTVIGAAQATKTGQCMASEPQLHFLRVEGIQGCLKGCPAGMKEQLLVLRFIWGLSVNGHNKGPYIMVENIMRVP